MSRLLHVLFVHRQLMATQGSRSLLFTAGRRQWVVFYSVSAHRRVTFHRGTRLYSCKDGSGDGFDNTPSKWTSSPRDYKLTEGDPELRERVIEELKTRSFGGIPWNELSKGSRSKRVAIRVKSILKAERRRREVGQSQRVQRGPLAPSRLSERKQELKKLKMAAVNEAAMRSGLRVAVDCTWDDSLSSKQMMKLVSQIKLMHSLNMRAEMPARLYLTGLCEGGRMWQESYRQIRNGFQSLFISAVTEKSYTQFFSRNELVYLSPESPHLLTSLDTSKVYVIGGLVDDSINKGLTLQKAEVEQVATAKLPLMEYMNMREPNPAHCILCLNQVLGILLDVNSGKGWPRALDCHIPKRKGFILKPEFQYTAQS